MAKPSATFSSVTSAGFHLLGSQLRLAEDQRQGHGEATGVRGADPLPPDWSGLPSNRLLKP
jgi:hypothetical protein